MDYKWLKSFSKYGIGQHQSKFCRFFTIQQLAKEKIFLIMRIYQDDFFNFWQGVSYSIIKNVSSYTSYKKLRLYVFPSVFTRI